MNRGRDAHGGKVTRGYHGRTVGTRPTRKRFLIVCEGAKTDPRYFRSFPATTQPNVVDPEIIPRGCNSLSLVEMAVELKKAADVAYDSVWVVMNREDPAHLPACRFNEAIQLAKRENIQIACSNEAFELWYLLHFDDIDAELSRMQHADKLTKRLGKKYKKNTTTMYDDLLSKQPDAIRSAGQLLETYLPHNPERDNPSTTVFKLVEELNKYLPGC